MTITKYNEVVHAAYEFANVVESGSRLQYKKWQGLVYDWVLKNCREKHKTSKFIVYKETINLDRSERYSDYTMDLRVCEANDFRETEKCYISPDGTRYLKSHIVGWLSK